MPVTETTTLHIVCDNAACPGNRLDPADRTGWMFLGGEVYGEPTLPQRVFCSNACVAAFATEAANPKSLVSWPETAPEAPEA